MSYRYDIMYHRYEVNGIPGIAGSLDTARAAVEEATHYPTVARAVNTCVTSCILDANFVAHFRVIENMRKRSDHRVSLSRDSHSRIFVTSVKRWSRPPCVCVTWLTPSCLCHIYRTFVTPTVCLCHVTHTLVSLSHPSVTLVYACQDRGHPLALYTTIPEMHVNISPTIE